MKSAPSLNPLNVYARRKKLILMLLFGYAVLLGALVGLSVFTEKDEELPKILTFLLVSPLLFLWCRTDAESRDYPMSRTMMLALVGISLIAIPVYLLLSRGWRGILAILWLLFGAFLWLLFFLASAATAAV